MKSLIILGLVLLSFVAACQKQSSRLASQTAAPTASTVASRLEPLSERSPEGFRQAWAAFIKDRKFRMAQPNEVGGMPYQYSFANDVLVIVVDQTALDNSHLQVAYFLVYFKAPDYKLFWVDHNFNLANSRLGNASSVLYIYEGGEPSTRMAPLEWDAKRHKYTCLAT